VRRQNVAREAHRGFKSLLASRLRPLSSKATHPPNYRSLHSLHGVGSVAPYGVPRPPADTESVRHLAQVFRDAAEEASTAASDGTPVLARCAAVGMAFKMAQGPSTASAGASSPAPPGPGSG